MSFITEDDYNKDEFEVIDEDSWLDCEHCGSQLLVCFECGDFVIECECEEVYDAYCRNCNQISTIPQLVPYCNCEDNYTRLICDTCGVYRESIADDQWYWQGIDNAECFCDDADAKVECEECGVYRTHPDGEWVFDGRYNHSTYVKCRHYEVEVSFPDGTSVYASSMFDRNAGDIHPDFGLYLDSGWMPTCPSYSIYWRDYGTPTSSKSAAIMIADTYKKAQAGLWVEIGCIGGHGRTGTVLACMAVLSGMTPDDAIKHVQESYCEQAIETDDQKWWVQWFDAFINGKHVERVVEDKDKKQSTLSYSYKAIDWQNDDLVKASGNKPTRDPDKRTIVSKSQFAYKKTDQDAVAIGPKDHEFCDTCSMTPPCFCYNKSKGSATMEELELFYNKNEDAGEMVARAVLEAL